MSNLLPTLRVEGPDDVSVISALLARHGVHTRFDRDVRVLQIRDQGGVDSLLEKMRSAVETAVNIPVGFVLDTDTAIADRWRAVRARLAEAKVIAPEQCPPDGFIGRVPDYPHPCGVWLMPNCRTDGQKLENLCRTLVADDDPLWSHAESSTDSAARIVKAANDAGASWATYGDGDRVKAVIHSWLAWQHEPGVRLGAAITSRILRDDSPQAIAFLGWLKRLYSPHLDALRNP